ncbi:hypothetical protein [Flavobacterium sp.]|jgi:hypothetical protein|uniref:hypothetical protein n=1 Tax=Flavobacterium sp. TaxID=239 RepID=UPI0037BEF5A4
MIFGYFILTVALIISAVSAFYSITGLTAIFAAAFWPIIIMGSALEVGKIATTVWLHKYWQQAALRYKLYLVPAVAILMLITSMGIFGFLSKAHLDQAVPSGDVAAKVSLYDEKIQIQRENIKAARSNLAQLDAAVNETMGRSTSEQGADKAVAIRRAQSKDRAKLMQEIEQSQKVITQLQEDRAPLAAEQRKVEAEVGPIKYIAALIYDQSAADNSDLLERAVRWVIILIVSVFDPLALVLILAATQTVEWERSNKRAKTMDQVEDDADADGLKNFFYRGRKLARALDSEDELRRADEANELLAEIEPEENYEVAEEQPDNSAEMQSRIAELELEKGYLEKQVSELVDQIHEAVTEPEPETVEPRLDVDALKKLIESKQEETQVDERPGDYVPEAAQPVHSAPVLVPEAAPGRNRGVMTAPAVVADNATEPDSTGHSDFGATFPAAPEKGDTYLRIDYLPNRLFKFNGNKWIELDKDNIDVYAYDELYIKHLIEQISSGKMDVDQLSELERDQIRKYLEKV